MKIGASKTKKSYFRQNGMTNAIFKEENLKQKHHEKKIFRSIWKANKKYGQGL